MADLINVQKLVISLKAEYYTCDELMRRVLENLHKIERCFLYTDRNARNIVRITIAYIVTMYDLAQSTNDVRVLFPPTGCKISHLEERIREAPYMMTRPHDLSIVSDSDKLRDSNLPDGRVLLMAGEPFNPDLRGVSCDLLLLEELNRSHKALTQIRRDIVNNRSHMFKIDREMELITAHTFDDMMMNRQSLKDVVQEDGFMMTLGNLKEHVRGRTPLQQTKDMKLDMADTNIGKGYLPTQEDLGYSRVGQGDVPDVTRSSPLGEKSCEGHPCVGAACAHGGSATAVDEEVKIGDCGGLDEMGNAGGLVAADDAVDVDARETSAEKAKDCEMVADSPRTVGKRKARSPPELLTEKNRAKYGRILCFENKTESPESERIRAEVAEHHGGDMSFCDVDAEEEVIHDPGAVRRRDTPSPEEDASRRRSERIKGCEVVMDKMDFSQLISKRRGKLNRRKTNEPGVSVDLTQEASGLEYGEDNISVVSHVSLESVDAGDNERDDSWDDKRNESNRRTKKKLDPQPRRTSKNSNKLRELEENNQVTEEDLKKELVYDREDWLDKTGAELGSRQLDYLWELDKQWQISTNIAGFVKGRMKNLIKVTKNISKTLVEKVEASGDVLLLRTQNLEMKDKIKEMERRDSKCKRELEQLHKKMAEMRREIDNLKEGVVSPPANAAPSTAFSTKEDRKETSRRLRAEYTKKDNLALGAAEVGSSGNDGNGSERLFSIDQFKRPGLRPSQSLYKRGVRVVGNVQVAPPRSKDRTGDTSNGWTFVTNRRSNRRDQNKLNQNKGTVPMTATSESELNGGTPVPRFNYNKQRPMRRINKPAVVTINSNSGDRTNADLLREARNKISLEEIGITNPRVRTAANGGIVIEVPGANGQQLANVLCTRIQNVLSSKARVASPMEMGELRIRGIDHSTTKSEVIETLSKISGCHQDYLKASEVNKMRDGLGVIWVHCPINQAAMIAQTGTIMIGWTRVRVDLLRKRPVQCFRCWQFGHVRNSCKSKVERTGSCFRCGAFGHLAQQCREPFRCAACAEMGRDSKHRMGSFACAQNQGFSSGIVPMRRLGAPIWRTTSCGHTYLSYFDSIPKCGKCR